MNVELVIGLASKSLTTALLIASPMLAFGLAVGLLISIFQAVTQIQEMTLTFIPKILAVVAAVIIFFPWMIQLMVSFTVDLYSNLPTYIGR